MAVEITHADGQKKKSSSGIFQDVVNSIFEPGVNRGVLVVMNAAFAGLFLILFYLLFATRFNIHVCALTLIATGLFVSIQWFVRELAVSKNKSQNKNKDEKSDKTSAARRPTSLAARNKLKKL
ncbi:hypothetical protein IWW45_001432 [Coemansia sp. RSA 485]|nr:hypothetical protein IWW45_001432 [Coemansia sp. RSA 485]